MFDASPAPPSLRIDFTKATLDNGLDVIVRRQPDLPIVALNLWYHVGSKDEEPKQRGFAHLFEHLMFEGSAHYPGDFFKPLQRLGAGINGSTSSDRTNYFIDLPSAHFETAIAMESDRMASLLPALTDESLRVQKDVVKNEYRQNYANRPYGHAWRIVAEALYPNGHPYRWLTIGVMEDVEAASRSDVAAFFGRYYVPANASLALVGDLTIDDALALADRYFGAIPGGAKALRPRVPPVELTRDECVVLRDRVQLDRCYLTWPTVPSFAEDDAALGILGDVLTRGRASRLYRRLVIDEQLVQDISAHQSGRELAGSFSIVATMRPGCEIARARAVIDAELRALATDGPSAEEMERARNGVTSSFVFALDNIGGFGGIADRLNAYNTYLGDPGRINGDLDRFIAVTPEAVREAATRFLHDRPKVALDVIGRAPATVSAPLDRSLRPVARASVPYAAPVPQVRTLESGTQLWLMPRRNLPLVAASAVVRAGASSHSPEFGGLASLTASMLDEGTATRSAHALALETERLGTSLSTSSGWDGTYAQFQCLSEHLIPSFELAADVLIHASFPEAEWGRVHGQVATALRAQRDSAESLAQRAFLSLLFPETHPYHLPVEGSEATVARLTRERSAQFHQHWFGPDVAAWVIAGDFDPDRVTDLVARMQAGWNARAGGAAIESIAFEWCRTRYVLVDKPAAAQAVVRVGQPGIARCHDEHDALMLWNQIFGGQFSSRLNEVLREQKGYTYGVRSHFDARRGAGPFWIGASIQADRVVDALQDLQGELRALLTHRPPTEQEIDDARRSLIEGQARHFETPGALVSRFAHLYLHDLPPDHHARLASRLEAISRDQLIASAARVISPEELSVVVVADAESTLRQFERAGIAIEVWPGDRMQA